MIAMMDPVRDDAKPAVFECKRAGIKPIMITGDHPATALAIAMQLGIAEKNSHILTGDDLETMAEGELVAQGEKVALFARVSPEHKLKIIEMLRKQGHIVAMTGDGVNDAPALKAADIGVAMGLTGTDVSKEAADMVLLDDNFSTIVAAVREGRRIYDNIRKFVLYILAGNLGEVLVMLVGPLLGLPLPLLPIQILWINLVSDGLPAIALGYEPPEKNVMQRPPRHPEETIFAHGLGWDIVIVGIAISALSLAFGLVFFDRLGAESKQWQTIIFTTLTFCQLGLVLSIRSRTSSLFSISLGSNVPLVISVVISVLLQFLLIYYEPLQPLFKTTALSGGQLAMCMGGAVFTVAIYETIKKLHSTKTQ
jgi:Ca2+-transporting ATPase